MTLQIGATPEVDPKASPKEAPPADPKPTGDPKPGDPGYNEAMQAKFRSRSIEGENVTDTPADVPAKPDIGADKFYDPKTGTYNWEAHAREQAFNAQRGQKTDAPAGGDTKETPGDQEVTDVVTAAGLSMDDLRTSILTDGALTEAQMGALTKVGLPQALVEEYVENAKFRMEAETQAAVAYAGGEEETNRLLAWAEKNFDPETKARVNAMLAGPAWKDGIDLIKARAPRGEGQRVSDTALTNGDQTVTGYRSRAEMLRDMRVIDETTGRRKYETDPAYRRAVEQKIARSRFEADRPTELQYHQALPVNP